jgi:peptide/nickel transport system substrate-binding protein
LGKLGTLLAVTLGFLAIAIGGAVAAPQQRDELVIGINEHPPTLMPLKEPAWVSNYLLGFISRPISGWDSRDSEICFLCTEIPTFENQRERIITRPDGSKGMEVRITLKDNLFWGDGEPVTAKDAEFTFKLRAQWNAGLKSPAFAAVESVKALDERTFVLTLDKVRFGHEAWLWKAFLLPRHIEAALVEKAKGRTDYENVLSTYITAPNTPGLWNGPYIVADANAGEALTLKINPHWQGDKPYFKKIVLKFIKPDQYVSKLIAGEFDYAPGELGMPAIDGLNLLKTKADLFDIKFKQSSRVFFLLPNHTNPILSRVGLRKALMMSTDREDIATKLLGDKQTVADTMIAPGMPGYDPGVYRYRYDPAAAAVLFDQEGFKLGADGVRVNAAGQRLSFDMVATLMTAATAEMIKQQWAKVGVEIKLRPVEVKAFFETVKSGDFSFILYNHVISPGAIPAWFLSTEAIARPVTDDQNSNAFWLYNYSRYSNPEMDALTLKLEEARTPDERIIIWRRFQQLYVAQLPGLPIMWNMECYVMPNWLTGVEPTGHTVPSSYHAEMWRVDL